MTHNAGTLTQKQFTRLSHAIQDLNPMQLAWSGGYISGLAQQEPPHFDAEVFAAPAETTEKTIILYGSHTGNSRHIALQLCDSVQALGGEAVLSSMLEYKTAQLKKERRLLVVVSTHGEGEPPDEALGFYKFLHSDRAPGLKQLEYAVLALGDSSYEHFCRTGADIDNRLLKLGAKPIVERVDCDLDYEQQAATWQEAVVEKISAENETPMHLGGAAPAFAGVVQPVAMPGFNEHRPFYSEILHHVQLTGGGSAKDVMHLELSLENSGISYQPGDALGIIPDNCPALVNGLINCLGYDANRKICLDGNVCSLREMLENKLEITLLSRRVLKNYAQAAGNGELAELVQNHARATQFIAENDVVDLVEKYPPPEHLDERAFVEAIRPLTARLYSVASSLESHPGEVHVMIKRLEYMRRGKICYGSCSNCVAAAAAGDKLPVFVRPNPNFKPPADDAVKMIMIGTGTGVAPYRGFLHQREMLGKTGNTWLIFGDRHFRTDFCYQREWQYFLKNGVLERISLAFSRDQERKIYVQQRIAEEAEILYRWLQEGACIYVCGDASRMAKDVHRALADVVRTQGRKSAAAAADYLDELIADRRYQRDVY